MKSQWECLLQNLGEWQGSFTTLSPQGAILSDVSTTVCLETIAPPSDHPTVRQTIQKGDESSPIVLEYDSLGRGVLFLDNGAFSQGSLQLAPFAEFGAELGLIVQDRRLRLVQRFDRQGHLSQLILIREKRARTQPPDSPDLTVDQLIGDWQGFATTLYPDWSPPDTYTTQLKLERSPDRPHTIQQTLSFGSPDSPTQIQSIGTLEGSILTFGQPDQSIQVLLLPNGASATFPQTLQLGQPFFLELGWLWQPGFRHRLMRRYNAKGEWTSLTLIEERL